MELIKSESPTAPSDHQPAVFFIHNGIRFSSAETVNEKPKIVPTNNIPITRKMSLFKSIITTY